MDVDGEVDWEIDGGIDGRTEGGIYCMGNSGRNSWEETMKPKKILGSDGNVSREEILKKFYELLQEIWNETIQKVNYKQWA